MGIDALVAYDARAAAPHAAERRRYPLAAGPTGVALDPAGRRAVVWSQFDRALNVIALADAPAAEPDEIPAVARIPLEGVEPAIDATIALGRKLFHAADVRISRDGRACASCHPSGRDDALTWATPDGPRQTPMLAGRLEETAPYGWNGAGATVRAHLGHTFERLGGSGLDPREIDALIAYVGAIAAPPGIAGDAALVRRGAALFASDQAGCASCHAGGGAFTDGAPHDVGSRAQADKDEKFDTPSLRFVGGTAPYFHDGRYPTLRDVLRHADGSMGHTAHLSGADLDALEAYLRSL
jgi:mono/diheme cytochrome c family protein